MGIWIRSQDKKRLVKVENFYIKALDQKLESANGNMGAYIDDENGRYSINDLGIYSTKDKAIKVLDMIEKFIENRNKIIDMGFEFYINSAGSVRVENDTLSGIYQMPLDEEV